MEEMVTIPRKEYERLKRLDVEFDVEEQMEEGLRAAKKGILYHMKDGKMVRL